MARHGPLGVHLALGGGYQKALAEAKRLGISCCQLFTHNPRGWQFAPLKEDELKVLKASFKEQGISPVVSHCNYLINLGTKSAEIRKKSIECMKKEFEYAKAFGCDAFVLHVGKHKDESLDDGIKNVAAGINEIKKEMKDSGVLLLLETVAGQGTEIGREFETLGKIIELVDEDARDLMGICLDTCHVFAAGYDLRDEKKVEFLIKEFDRTIGIKRLKFIHLNDSLKDVGERRDRHVHIGEGFIGKKGFKAFLNHPKIVPIPKVLETPDDGTTGDLENLATIRKLQA